MERCALLDASRRSSHRRLIFFLLLLIVPTCVFAQVQDPAAGKLSEIKNLYEGKNWDAVVNATSGSPQSVDLLLYRGLALAHLQRREEARISMASRFMFRKRRS